MKAGDLVRLKTGGHVMMIASVEKTEVTCLQCDGGDSAREKFPVDSLEKVDEVDFCSGVTRPYFE